MTRKALALQLGLMALVACSDNNAPSPGGQSTPSLPGPVSIAGAASTTTAGAGSSMTSVNPPASTSTNPSGVPSAGMSTSPIASAGRGAPTPPAAAGRSAGSAGQSAQAGHSASGASAPPPAGDPMVKIDNPPPKPSAGCGMAAPMAGDSTIDVMGMSREYILALPQGYDANKPYKLIFAWHGLGGTAAQVASNWYGLQRMSNNSTIFVAGQGLNTTNSVGSGPGWANTNGEDVAFVKALYAKLQTTTCIDENRVFSVGMSYGGIMSNTLGCQMGDVLRAIAPMSGAGPGYGGRATCVGQVAVWQSHGDNDTTVPTASGEMSRDFWVKANHCQMQTVSVDPSPCIAYVGCDEDLPVTFCEFSGGHTIPPFAAAAIWKFFAQF
jgi:polyhydroxybutyrate depolymerase